MKKNEMFFWIKNTVILRTVYYKKLKISLTRFQLSNKWFITDELSTYSSIRRSQNQIDFFSSKVYDTLSVLDPVLFNVFEPSHDSIFAHSSFGVCPSVSSLPSFGCSFWTALLLVWVAGTILESAGRPSSWIR